MATFLTVTFASGTAALVGSATVPWIALENWATAGTATNDMINSHLRIVTPKMKKPSFAAPSMFHSCLVVKEIQILRSFMSCFTVHGGERWNRTAAAGLFGAELSITHRPGSRVFMDLQRGNFDSR